MPLLPVIPRSAGQLRADKKLSASRALFEQLMQIAQQALDSRVITDATIVKGLSVLSGILVKSLWELQIYDQPSCNAFLSVVKKLLPANVDIAATLYDPDISTDEDGNFLFEQWFMTLAQYGVKPQLLKMEPVYKEEFWSRRLSKGVAHIHFVVPDTQMPAKFYDTWNNQTAKRSSVVMQFLHFLLIACKTRLEINGASIRG